MGSTGVVLVGCVSCSFRLTVCRIRRFRTTGVSGIRVLAGCPVFTPCAWGSLAPGGGSDVTKAEIRVLAAIWLASFVVLGALVWLQVSG